MTSPKAQGERFIAVSGDTVSILDIARLLRRKLGPRARRVPRLQAPGWLVRLAARRIPLLQAVVPMLGKVRRATGAKAETMLGWQARSGEAAILSTAESLIRLGLVKA